MANETTTKTVNHIVALFDSDTKDQLSASDLECSDSEYSQAIDDSYASPDACGHVRVNGRRVYADIVGYV